ncbi:MAG: amidohydrolase [Coriobacteriia bacterium]|nr:amidohydrolase [Coriobacteriia bacterium]MCL2750749.1 amidohydrolase [Coriobacteriia bacterium]
MSILFAKVDYLSKDYTVEHGYVLVEGATIVYAGPDDPRQNPSLDAGKPELIPTKGTLLIPGLYNIHTHIPMTLLRGYAEGLKLDEWLHTKVFPFEALISPQAALHASEVAIAEMLRFGTVGFSDMYNFTHERAEAVWASGIKANLSYGTVVFDEEQRYEDLPQKDELEQLVKTYHNTADGRLKMDLFVHSEYLSNPHVTQGAGEHARAMGVSTHIHLSETEKEHKEAKERRGGLTPTAFFDSLGFFAQPCTAAHCVWTEPEDWQIMAKRGVTAAHNPCSNAKLASGIAPLAGMLGAGVNVGLGTDGVASNNNLNIMKELYSAVLFARARELDPQVVTTQQALAMATINGAKSQGRENAGFIAEGAAADLVLLNTEGPWMQPVHSQRNNLVYSAQGSDVCLTMVNGRVLYSHGEYKTIDLERATAATSQAAREIVASLSQ